MFVPDDMDFLNDYYEYENEINIEEEVWNESVYLKTYDTTYYNFGSSLEDWNQKLKIKTTEFKHDATFRLNPFHEFMTGVSIQHLDYRYQRDEEENYTWASTLAGSQDTTYNGYSEEDHECIFPTSYKIAAYVEDNWQIHDHLFANIGFRADYFHFNRDLSLSPRINFSYLTGFGGIFRAAWGYYYQSPSYKELKYSYETSRNTKAQVAIHNVFGFEYPIDSYLTFKIETYYKNFNNLISFESREGRLIYSRNNDSKGYAAGVDILLNLNLQRFSGWISYGLLKAKEDSLGGQKKFFPRATDQRHTLSFVGDVHLGAQWRLRVKALYGSGFPYTPYHYELNKDDRWNRVYSDKNSDRYPAYERLDIRLGRGFTWGKIFFDGYVEVLNVFNKENIFSYHWRYENNVWHRQATTLFPRIPNIGIAVKF